MEIFKYIIFAYWTGLLLGFTPCVYPMIPVTIGYFSSQSREKNKKVVLHAAVYIIGLAITYGLLGTIAAIGGKAFGSTMQTLPVQIGIIVLLIALAFSMFGLYEIRPPSFISRNATAKSGLLGAFLMGAIFGLVASPCVGPALIGFLTLVAKLENTILGFSIFFSMALGLGTPLFVLAIFSGILPSPGMWMVTVKKIGGFMFLGAAAYFMIPLLPDSMRIIPLPLVFFTGGIYMLFFERTKNESRAASKAIAVIGICAIVTAVFILAPHFTKPKSTEKIAWVPYSQQQLDDAAKHGKPVMMEFSADWCGICKEMEAGPLIDQEVINESKRFIAVHYDGTDASTSDKIQQDLTHYNVDGFPTIIFFNSKGKEDSRIIGFAEAAELVEKMKKIK